MSAFLPYILAAGGAVIALVLAFFRGQSAGANKERVKQAEERQKANDIANEIDGDIGALPPEMVKKGLKEWSSER